MQMMSNRHPKGLCVILNPDGMKYDACFDTKKIDILRNVSLTTESEEDVIPSDINGSVEVLS